jgi:hypothetical protein
VADCAACARFAAAERQLQRDLAMVRETETPSTPLARIREQVEQRRSPAPVSSNQEISIMAHITRQFRRRPRLSVSIGAIAVLLLVMTLVPFRIDKSIGYEVAQTKTSCERQSWSG